ncbi:MAG: DUF4124 domain-containing protein [Zoogloeaceae bacterium]|nr:DUF4124 domain-containing protein [Zoogloeaceae bacterium]
MAQGETYKCKQADGSTVYKDMPCDGESKTHGVYADEVITQKNNVVLDVVVLPNGV